MHRSRGSLLAGLLVGTLVLSEVAGATAERCAAVRLRAAARKAATKIGCHRKALLAGTAPDAACLARAEAKFVRACAAADARGDCLTTGDAASVEAIVDQFIADLLDDQQLEPAVDEQLRGWRRVLRRFLRQQWRVRPDRPVVRLRRPDLLHLLGDDVHDLHHADLLDDVDAAVAALEPGPER